MKKFDRKFLELFYVISDDILESEQIAYFDYLCKTNRKRTICGLSGNDCICEEVYFNQWDVNESCVNAVDKIIKQILNNYSQTHDIEDLEFKYPIKQFLSEINYSTLSNFKNFHKFLDLLKMNANGYLKICVGKDSSSYFEPPTQFSTVGLVENYYEYIERITQDKHCLADKLEVIFDELFNLDCLGTINIAVSLLKTDEEILKAAIEHELTHFLKFLIRLNSMNFNYGLNWSKKEFKYFDNPNEWKELAVTYIEELQLIFNKLNLVHDVETAKQFANVIYLWSDISFRNPVKSCDEKLVRDIFKKLSELLHRNEIEEFIRVTYENSNDSKSVRNVFKVFNKVLINSLKK